MGRTHTHTHTHKNCGEVPKNKHIYACLLFSTKSYLSHVKIYPIFKTKSDEIDIQLKTKTPENHILLGGMSH